MKCDPTCQVLDMEYQGWTNSDEFVYMFVPLSAAGKFRFHNFATSARFIDGWGYLL